LERTKNILLLSVSKGERKALGINEREVLFFMY